MKRTEWVLYAIVIAIVAAWVMLLNVGCTSPKDPRPKMEVPSVTPAAKAADTTAKKLTLDTQSLTQAWRDYVAWLASQDVPASPQQQKVDAAVTTVVTDAATVQQTTTRIVEVAAANDAATASNDKRDAELTAQNNYLGEQVTKLNDRTQRNLAALTILTALATAAAIAIFLLVLKPPRVTWAITAFLVGLSIIGTLQAIAWVLLHWWLLLLAGVAVAAVALLIETLIRWGRSSAGVTFWQAMIVSLKTTPWQDIEDLGSHPALSVPAPTPETPASAAGG